MIEARRLIELILKVNYMADASKSQSMNTLFSKFLNIVGLLVAALFFSGWIYRWAYYDYFQLDVNSLDFSFESFLIVPIQVFFGTLGAALSTVGAFCLSTLVIYLFLWVLRNLEQPIESKLETRESYQGVTTQRRRPWLSRQVRTFLANNPLRLGSFRLLESFVNELVIILGVLVMLFWYTQARGLEDAQRDAYHCTSILPAVTFVAPINESAIIRPFQALDQVPLPTELDQFGIIGDTKLFDELLGKVKNVPADFRIWHLLQEGGGWLYIFQALPPRHEKGMRPPVLGLRTSLGKQLIILKPFVAGEECSQG